MLWLCVYFPQLGLEVCNASKKSAERPTVLLADNRVMQRNALARQRGIHIGTSLAAAHSIAADLVHMQRTTALETARIRYLSQVLYGFSSHVSIDSTPGGYLDYPNNIHHSLVLEISASLTLFGGLTALLRAVNQQLHELQHQACLQVAHTPLAALCGARWQHRGAEVARVLAADLSTLAAMPLECLALSPRQGEALHNMGLRNCGALLRLPSKELGQRFGNQLGHYLQQLTGTAPDPRVPIKPPQSFANHVHLLDACTSKTALLFPIKRLCKEFSHWLIAQQLGVCILHWEFANHSGDTSALVVRTTRASQSGELLLQLTQLQLERSELPRDVLDIRLASVELEPWQNHSDSLFPHLHAGPNSTSGETPLTELLDQLRARLGPNICSGVAIEHNHRPEQAWRAKPLTHVQNTRTASNRHTSKTTLKTTLKTKAVTATKPLAGTTAGLLPTDVIGKYRPTWLLPTPTPISRRALALLHGPERLQGGWWQNRRMRRDYYIAQTSHQQQHGSYSWVFCERERWYVHGYFG